MASKGNSLALSDEIFKQLADADQARGFPPGTMESLLRQEVGGDLAKFIQDPTAYHYAADAKGKRKSTARGPFGILDSTGAKPGYGVKPLGDKTSFAEHLRFAGDYLAARSKQSGSLHAGLAGYGEGPKYANQVTQRRDGAPAPVALAQAPVTAPAAVQPLLPTPISPAVAPPTPATAVPTPVEQAPSPAQANAWRDWTSAYRQNQAAPQPQDLAYDTPKPYVPPEVVRPDFMAALTAMGQNQNPILQPFAGFRPRTRG